MSEDIKTAFVDGFKGSWQVFFALFVVIFATIVAYSNRAHIVVAQEQDPADQSRDAA